MMHRGSLIILEGIDGSGKTTTAAAVGRALADAGHAAAFCSKKDLPPLGPFLDRFLGGLRSALWNARPDDPVGSVREEVWMYLHAAWYLMVADTVLVPALDAGKTLVLDGWYYKFLARHRANGDFGFGHTREVFARVPRGDLVVFLDVDPATCWERRPQFRASELGAHSQVEGEREPRERFVSYQGSVRRQFLALSREPQWAVVEGPARPEEVVGSIMTLLDDRKLT